MYLINNHHVCYNIMSAIASLIATYKRYVLVYIIHKKYKEFNSFNRNIVLNDEILSVKLNSIMASKQYVQEGPIFLTIKPVRGEPMMKELRENIQKMMNENVIRFLYIRYEINYSLFT